MRTTTLSLCPLVERLGSEPSDLGPRHRAERPVLSLLAARLLHREILTKRQRAVDPKFPEKDAFQPNPRVFDVHGIILRTR